MPPPEAQPLVEATTRTGIADNGAEHGQGFLSLEEHQEEEIGRQEGAHADGKAVSAAGTPALGLADGFTSWSESLHAFHTAIFHTCVYVALGVVSFSFIFENWPIIDSVYFSVVLFTTVGYGDFYPESAFGQLFTIAFALYGIVILGIFLGIVGEKIIAKQEEKKNSKIGDARHKILQTFQESSSGDLNNDTRATSEHNASKKQSTTLLRTVVGIFREQLLGIVVLTAFAIPIILIEKWDGVKGLYWMVITATSIGLGDDTPVNTWSKALCILYIPLSVAATGRLLSLIGGAYLDKVQDELETKFMSRTMTISDLQTIDVNKDGTVSKDEFLRFMLVTLQKVEQEDLDEIVNLFHSLDHVSSRRLFLVRLYKECRFSFLFASSLETGQLTRKTFYWVFGERPGLPMRNQPLHKVVQPHGSPLAALLNLTWTSTPHTAILPCLQRPCQFTVTLNVVQALLQTTLTGS